jgi:hypothetical protein
MNARIDSTMMTIAAYLIAAYPTREFDSGSWIGSLWSVNWSAPPRVLSLVLARMPVNRPFAHPPTRRTPPFKASGPGRASCQDSGEDVELSAGPAHADTL